MTKNNDTALLPCPFCGGEAYKHKYVDRFACSNHTCWLHKVFMAFEDWNTRPTTPQNAEGLCDEFFNKLDGIVPDYISKRYVRDFARFLDSSAALNHPRTVKIDGLREALKNSRFILIAEGIEDTGVVNEALAAYEDWKGKIEGEGK